MLENIVFYKKGKGGNIYKVVREHYLRDDIWCGSDACNKCKQREIDIVLSYPDAGVESSLFPSPYYLVVDTNIVLDQIDILEEDALQNVIILQTVLQELKHRSATVYKRLQSIISNPARRFYKFVNEHYGETFLKRKSGETKNDRNDRAIRLAAKWYSAHLNEQEDVHINVVLLTDDVQNRNYAKEEGISAFSMEEYIASLQIPNNLLEKLCRRTYTLESQGREIFPCHYTPAEIHLGIKNGTILQGSFLASTENYLEGNVNVEGMEKPILVQGRTSLNRAMDGDIVGVELLPESEWLVPSDIILEDNEIEEDEDDKLLSKTQLAAKKGEKKPTGKIVGIIRRKWRQYCGVLQPSVVQGKTRHLFVPAERKVPKVRIETRQSELLSTQRIIVAIDSWPRNSRYPLGHFVRALGKIGDKDTENEVLLLEHDVPHSRFSDAVLNCLPKLPWIITESDVAQREDLRHLDICSVDPPGCTDIDDALHARNLSNGNLEVGVHIADVTHFVRPGTAIDTEAALRATTVYLVDKRIDMLPDLLSSNLCSLRGNEERFAFSCIWELDKNAHIISTRFCKSIIRSRQAMTYDEAQFKIDDTTQNDSITLSLRSLNNLAKKLKKRRLDNGALVLASPEIRFRVDSETQDPIEVEAKKLKETNSMVEEFMLLANISVAEKILQEFPECAMLRRHPEPPQTSFEPLIKAGRNQGFEICTTSGKELAQSLEAAEKSDNPYFNTMLRILATRCMMQAVYFISGMHQRSEYFHYGLACPVYTHFTSPIRRYADIIVHRLLAVCIGADATYTDLLDKKKNHALCHNLNYRNRMAQYAGRASVALNTHLFFREKVEYEVGYILFVRKNALQVLIPKYGLEGTLYLTSKIEDPSSGDGVIFSYNPDDQSQTCGNIVFRTFDRVLVQLSLDRSNVQHEKLIFKLVEPQIPGFSISAATTESSTSKEKTVEVEDDKTSSKRKKKENIQEVSGSKKAKKAKKSKKKL